LFSLILTVVLLIFYVLFMKNIFIKICWLLVLALCAGSNLLAQDGGSEATIADDEKSKIRFNGLGRTILTQTSIAGDVIEADTNTIDRLTDGEFLLDLAINATPNKNSEVQAIVRLRNEFGGFFGAGMSIEVRELWARGIIADFVKYRVGDMDVVMSPYTLFSPDEEGFVNEPAVFQPLKQVIDYEQFYTDDNTRRLQGAKLDFGLNFGTILEDLDVSTFIAKIRGTDFFTIPNRLVTGGEINFSTVTFNDSLGLKADFGLNLVHTFDDLQSGNAVAGIRNTVATIEYDVTVLDKSNLSLHLSGESGRSNVGRAERQTTIITDEAGEEIRREEKNIMISEEDDTFMDVGLTLHLKKQNLTVFAKYIDIGPDFFSTGAQSKRIEYGEDKTYYNRIGTDRNLRQASLFDLSRDRALYTFRTADRLMAYDPRYSNTMPYGDATPNRQGLKFGIHYGEDTDKIAARVDGAFLTEIRGQGTVELKNFNLIKAAADFNLHQFLNWKNTVRATLGVQIETTKRGGLEVEQVDLTSNLIDLGLEVELFPKFDVLLGAKLFTSEGNDYVPQLSGFNEVRDFPGRYIADDQETLLGLGIKYEFKKDIYMTLQYNSFNSELGSDNPNNYNLQQFFVLYNMKF